MHTYTRICIWTLSSPVDVKQPCTKGQEPTIDGLVGLVGDMRTTVMFILLHANFTWCDRTCPCPKNVVEMEILVVFELQCIAVT